MLELESDLLLCGSLFSFGKASKTSVFFLGLGLTVADLVLSTRVKLGPSFPGMLPGRWSLGPLFCPSMGEGCWRQILSHTVNVILQALRGI